MQPTTAVAPATPSVESAEQVTGKRGREKQIGSARRRVKRAREARDADLGVSLERRVLVWVCGAAALCYVAGYPSSNSLHH